MPLAVGGSRAGVVAVDHALRPGLDRSITVRENGSVALDREVDPGLGRVVDSFAEALEPSVPLTLAATA